jgi:catechol 2,3-dioxygenase
VRSVSQHDAVERPAAHRLPDSARIEYAQFLVPNVPQSLRFYRDLVGLNELWSRGETTALAAARSENPLVLLTEDRTARPRPARSAGLYHLALRYPTRRDLASAFMRLHTDGWQFHGFADHGVSEALYMADADGNGVELYTDKPHEQWPVRNGELEMVTEPLNLDGLLSELTHPSPGPAGRTVTIGHVHLQVTDLQSSEIFYHDILGFDVMQRSFPGALFVSAGGYHHHIGLNVWNTRSGSRFKEGTAGLVKFGVHVGSGDALQSLSTRLQSTPYWSRESEMGITVHDPDNIQIELL